jgi:hypothetical protein
VGLPESRLTVNPQHCSAWTQWGMTNIPVISAPYTWVCRLGAFFLSLVFTDAEKDHKVQMRKVGDEMQIA